MTDNRLKEGTVVENSNTLHTMNEGNTNLLNPEPLKPSYDATGTSLVLQNSVQVSDISRDKDQHDLLEIDWSYKNTTSKPFIVQTHKWLSSNAISDNIFKFSFPRDYFLGNHVLQTVGDTFLSMRGDLHFVVTAHGTPVSSGSVIITPDFYPFNANNSQPLYDAFVRQFAILDISDNTATADLVVPFKWLRNGIDPFDACTMINAYVLAPLQGINEVSLTITVFLENQEFKFLRPINNPSLRDFRNRGAIGVKENIPKVTTTPTIDKIKEMDIRKVQGLVNVTTINNTLSDIQEATLPTNMTGDSLAVDTSLMDDVGVPTNPSGVIVKFNSLNNADNPQNIEKMALISKSQRVSTPATFNTTMDEMSYKHILCEREHLMREIKISKTVAAGEPVFSEFITPTSTIAQSANNQSPQVNLLQHVADKYKFWRGGIKYRIRFYMNRFQSIKIYCGLFYKANAPTVFQDWSSSHGAILDIGGDQREVTIEVPYNSETPWLQVPHGILGNLIGVDNSAFDYSMGQLSVYAVTPLISPEGSPNDIQMVITQMGAEDFELANYTPSNRTQASVLLSKRSLRTPNYITDVASDMKQYFSKWQLVSSSSKVGLSALHNYITCFCGEVFAKISATPSYATDDIILRKAEIARFEHLIHSHYCGGLKFRVELSKRISKRNEEAVSDDIVPYCYYVNPDQQDVIMVNTNTMKQVANALLDFKVKPINNISTPYIAQPVNSKYSESTVVYEVEVTFQKNVKYTMVNREVLWRPLDFGYLLFGFSSVAGEKLDPSTNYLSYNIYAKIADDGRFATIETGRFDSKPVQGSWCLEHEDA